MFNKKQAPGSTATTLPAQEKTSSGSTPVGEVQQSLIDSINGIAQDKLPRANLNAERQVMSPVPTAERRAEVQQKVTRMLEKHPTDVSNCLNAESDFSALLGDHIRTAMKTIVSPEPTHGQLDHAEEIAEAFMAVFSEKK